MTISKMYGTAVIIFLFLAHFAFCSGQNVSEGEQDKKSIMVSLSMCFRSVNFAAAFHALKNNSAVWNAEKQCLTDKLPANLKLKVYNYLAVLSAKENYHDAAAKFYELAIGQIKETNNWRQLVVLLENRMASLVRMHRTKEAAGYYQLINVIYTRKRQEIPYSVKNNMGTNYFFSGDYENALLLHKEAAEIVLKNAKAEKIKDDILIFYNVAWDYCAAGRIQDAIHYLSDIRKYIPEQLHPFLESRLLYLKAMVSPLNEVKNGILEFEKICPSGENEIRVFLDLAKSEIAKREHRWKDVAEDLVRALKLQHPGYLKLPQVKELPPGIQTYQARCAAIAEAFAKANDSKNAWLWIQRASLRAETDLDLKEKTGELADIMTVEARLGSATGDAQEILKLEQQYEKAKSELKTTNPALWQTLFSQRINLHPDDLDQIRHVLPPQSVLLEVAVIGDNIVFFICERSCPVKMKLFPLVKAERKIKRFILQFRQMVSSPGDEAAVQELCGKLYAMLFKPVEPEINKLHPRLILYSPTGILRYIPIAALHTGKSFLCEKYLFCNLSGYDLLRVNRSEQNKSLENFVGFANPDGTLPASEEECDAIGHLFAHSAVLKRDSATRNKFIQLSGEIDCLHVATHGVLDPAAPEKSRIIFADQPLKYSEMVAGLPFMKRLYMLTFSACNTASISGLNENAMEIYGMAYQFIRKTNSGATLATLWPVSDLHTRDLMQKFYESLITGQKNNMAFNRATALHTAQLFLLQNRKTAHPFYWAPFILIGNFN